MTKAWKNGSAAASHTAQPAYSRADCSCDAAGSNRVDAAAPGRSTVRVGLRGGFAAGSGSATAYTAGTPAEPLLGDCRPSRPA